jgi:hypothetical protein
MIAVLEAPLAASKFEATVRHSCSIGRLLCWPVQRPSVASELSEWITGKPYVIR